MKKQLLSGIIALCAFNADAQVVADTVSLGASYANQVWYSLENDEQGSSAKNNWDLAFATGGFGSSILINSAGGTRLWNYPNADISGWSTVDTTGLYAWETRWNADTSWELGAMGRYADPSNAMDLDWGIYNMTTHVVTGDSIYIIKAVDGSYKKLMIENLTSGTYNFKYADLDGSNEQTKTLVKTDYTGKNFGYFSLSSGAGLNREPASADWDLTFTQYSAFIPSAYTVTGVLSNAGVLVAKCEGLADKTTFIDYASASFHSEINTIGYDWKSFNGTAYDVQDSTVFFVEPANGDIWKVIFTGFSGSTTGSFMFTKEKLFTNTSSVAGSTPLNASMTLYPNPATSGSVQIVYSFPIAVSVAHLTVTDMNGRVVFADLLNGEQGKLHQYTLSSEGLTSGVYMISVAAGNYIQHQKFIKQ